MISRCIIFTSARLRRQASTKSIQKFNPKCRHYHLFSWDSTATEAAIWGNAKMRSFSSAFGWFQQVPKLEWSSEGKDMSEINDLIVQYAQDGNHMEAQECLVTLEQKVDEVFPNPAAYSAVLDAWLRESKDATSEDDEYICAEKATMLLFRMREKFNEGFKPSIQQHNAVLEAWVRVAKVKGAPQQAQKILEEMEREPSSKCAPLIESYNLVLSAWAQSQEHLRGSAAQEIFERIRLPKTDDTYRTMIHAWANSKEVKAAFRATGHLMKMLRLLQDQHEQGEMKSMEPSVEDYHAIFQAWTEARDKHAAGKALNVLRLLEDAYIKRYSDVQADLAMYRYILQTHARSKVVGEPASDDDDGNSPTIRTHGPSVDRLLTKIFDRQFVPDTACFAFAITTYANCATHENLIGDSLPLAKRAEALLHEMVKSTLRSDAVIIGTDHYNTVLRSFTSTKEEEAADTAFKLLDTMEESSDERIWPNATTYSLVLSILTKSQTKCSKVEEGEKLVKRAYRQAEKGNCEAKPDVNLYNALISLIAASDSPSERTFRKVIRILNEIHQSENIEADSKTFHNLLEASASLLETGPLQFRAMEQAFSRACNAGMIDRPLLTLFRELAPPSIFSRVVVDAAEIDDDGTRIIPATWSRNVSTGVLLVDKPIQAALTVGGEFVFTEKMREKQMHKLRHRINQKILRGGRL